MADHPSHSASVARLSHEHLRSNLDTTLKRIADARIPAIEIELRDAPTDTDALITTVAQFQRFAQNHHLRLSGLILPASEISIGTSLDERRNSAVVAATNALDVASKLGVSTVTIPPAVVRNTESRRLENRYEDAFRHAIVELSELRHLAATKSVRLDCRVAHAGFLTSPMDARDFLDRCNSAWVGARINASAVRSIGVVEDWLQTLGHRVFTIELNEPAECDTELHDEIFHSAARFNDNAVISVTAGSE
jgi:sugar phosphate isomerase/epimerase